jgi:hypothetical protein
MAKTPKSKPVSNVQNDNSANYMAEVNTKKAAAVNADGSTGTDIAGNAAKAEADAVKMVKKALADAAKAEAKALADAAKAEAKALAGAAKAEAKALAGAAKAEKQTATTEARAQAKADREARIEALKADGKNYTGSMLALADRVKSGAYIKGATGQLRSDDELAQTLDGVGPNGVIELAKHVLGVEANPYTALNVGQQSMNFRNRMRGAIKKGTLTIQDVKDAMVELDVDATELLKAKAAEKAEKAEARKVAAAEKAKPVAEVEETAEAE